MKTQVLGKKLQVTLLFTLISATGLGVSSPAQSTSLIGSQGKVNNANPEAILIARHKCRPKPHCNPGYMRIDNEPSSSVEPSRDDIEENIRSQPYRQQHQPSTNAEPSATVTPSPTVEPPPTAIPSTNAELSPIAEPSPQN